MNIQAAGWFLTVHKLTQGRRAPVHDGFNTLAVTTAFFCVNDQLCPWRSVLLAALMLLGSAGSMNCKADDAPLCRSGCRLAVGLGNTYHYWGDTDAVVLAATAMFDQDRYELGAFRFASRQTMIEAGWSHPHVMAEPYWGFSASRRWRLFATPTWRLFFGFGVSYKTEEDPLNGTHWNFASQLAIRLHHPPGAKPDLEVCIRHWSNAGLRLPNRGQDFVTISLVF